MTTNPTPSGSAGSANRLENLSLKLSAAVERHFGGLTPWTNTLRKTVANCLLRVLREEDHAESTALRSAAEKALAAWFCAPETDIRDQMAATHKAMSDLRSALNSQPKTK